MNPICLWRRASLGVMPFTTISPDVGVSRPAISRRSVVLPHPDGPRSVTVSPSATSKVTGARASSDPNDFETSRSSIRGGTTSERTRPRHRVTAPVVSGNRGP